jgi:hypothetical protein
MSKLKSLRAGQPGSFWAMPLTLNLKEFFKSTAKILAEIATGNAILALAELPGLVSTAKLETPDEERAWTLVLRAYQRAICNVLIEYIQSNDPISSIATMNWQDINIENIEIEIDPTFLTNPRDSNILNSFKAPTLSWMISNAISQTDAENLLSRIPSSFACEIHNEWVSNSSFYESIKKKLESPFLPAAVEELQWIRYRSYLRAIPDERVFEESFSLRQIFVETRGYCHNKIVADGRRDHLFPVPEKPSESPSSLRAFWLADELVGWISKNTTLSSIRLVSGGPGAGKSSLSKILAGRLAEAENIRAIVIPLHQLTLEGSFKAAVGDYLRLAGHFDHNPLEKLAKDERTVLILDGLDELQMQGKAAQEAALQFINELIRLVDSANTMDRRLVAIVCGRELAIQSTESHFKGDGDIIHIIPYFVPPDEVHAFGNPKILEEDQRDRWWTTYGKLTGQTFLGIPKQLTEGELGEVTTQPLLNYLVALSYRRGGIALDAKTNINTVYSDLLSAVYERGWAKHNHPAVQGVDFPSFVRLLEEVALSVWHGAGRTTTLKEVEEHCLQSRVANLLPSLEAGATSGVSSLLLAFYFRQKGRRTDGDKTFEFTHKSFGEYLTALRVVRLIERVATKLAEYRENADEGWDVEEALYQWLIVCGPAPVDVYLLAFIRREVDIRGDAAATSWQKYLCRLLDAKLRCEWPMHRFPGETFGEQVMRARNAEEALVAAVNACAIVSKEMSRISWPTSTAAGGMLKRLHEQRQGPTVGTLHRSLSYFDFSHQCFDMADLYGANLRKCNFRAADLHYANLVTASIDGADFTSARFLETNMEAATVRDTIFSSKGLSDLILRERRNVSFTKRSQLRLAKLVENMSAELTRRGAVIATDEALEEQD